MTVDGFQDEHQLAFRGFDEDVADRLYSSVAWVGRALRVKVSGLEKIPAGRALLVANHAFGWDPLFPMSAVWTELHRRVWVLGEHAWWKFPFVRRLAAAAGTVDGTQENVNALLSRDELVLVLPGGLREAVKPRELRYRLLWGDRYGFVRAAIRNQTPIVPLASVGTDELFDFMGNAFVRGERLLHRRGFPIPLPSRLFPIPHLVPLRFIVGDPIQVNVPAEAANDEAAVRRIRYEVAGALHELIDEALARRAGVAPRRA